MKLRFKINQIFHTQNTGCPFIIYTGPLRVTKNPAGDIVGKSYIHGVHIPMYRELLRFKEL